MLGSALAPSSNPGSHTTFQPLLCETRANSGESSTRCIYGIKRCSGEPGRGDGLARGNSEPAAGGNFCRPRTRGLFQGSVIKTHGDGFPWFSARRAGRGDASASQNRSPVRKALGRPPGGLRAKATGSRRPGRVRLSPEGVGKPKRCSASPTASLLPGEKRTRSLWVFTLILGINRKLTARVQF